MDPIDDVLLALMASITGDIDAARRHLETARQRTQAGARRHRQVVEIAGLVVAGVRERAEGLAFVHAAEFPEDAELLARVTRHDPARPSHQ